MGKISKAMKIVPESMKNLSKIADDVGDASRKTADKLKRTDTGPSAVKPLDVGSYKDLKAREVKGDALEHDHIPSSAALKKAKEKELGRKLTPKEARAIHDRGATIEVPKEVHAKGDTWRGRNTTDRIESDSQDLSAAAQRDYATTRRNLIEHGYTPEQVDKALERLRELNRSMGI